MVREPLLQEPAIIELIDELTRRNARYDFNIETNGTIIPSFHRDNVWFTYDYKTPSSLAEDAMNLDIFKVATPADIIKFVVGSMQDLDRMDEILKTYISVLEKEIDNLVYDLYDLNEEERVIVENS